MARGISSSSSRPPNWSRLQKQASRRLAVIGGHPGLAAGRASAAAELTTVGSCCPQAVPPAVRQTSRLSAASAPSLQPLQAAMAHASILAAFLGCSVNQESPAAAQLHACGPCYARASRSNLRWSCRGFPLLLSCEVRFKVCSSCRASLRAPWWLSACQGQTGLLLFGQHIAGHAGKETKSRCKSVGQNKDASLDEP